MRGRNYYADAICNFFVSVVIRLETAGRHARTDPGGVLSRSIHRVRQCRVPAAEVSFDSAAAAKVIAS